MMALAEMENTRLFIQLQQITPVLVGVPLASHPFLLVTVLSTAHSRHHHHHHHHHHHPHLYPSGVTFSDQPIRG